MKQNWAEREGATEYLCNTKRYAMAVPWLLLQYKKPQCRHTAHTALTINIQR